MDGYSISEVSDKTGFSSSTLRFYDKAGLVCPDRIANGYRRYQDEQLERLAFVSRAKSFGLSLEDIAGLLTLLEAGSCEAVQGRLSGLLTERIEEADRQISELGGLAADLRAVAASLGDSTAEGPCDDYCGCTTDQIRAVDQVDTIDTNSGSEPNCCSLPQAQQVSRLDEWRRLAATATEQTPVDGGQRLTLPARTDLAALGALVSSETQCCPSFRYVITVSPSEVVLDVMSPAQDQAVVRTLLGAKA